MSERPEAVVVAHLIREMCLRGLSVREAAVFGRIHLKTSTRYLASLHDDRLVHVAEWVKDTRGFFTIRKFRWGSLPDIPRPGKPTTSTERVRAMRARKKQQ